MSFAKNPNFVPIGLPLWAHPLPEEPAHGLLLRLAQINGYPYISRVERETGLSLSALQRGRQYEEIAAVVRCSLDEIARHSFFGFDSVNIRIKGEAVNCMHDFHQTLRRACPACLRESPHHRFLWDLAFVTSCPKHRIQLVDKCSCGSARPLSWSDGRLYRGNCCQSGDIRTVQGEPASLAVQEMDSYFAGRLGLSKRVAFPALDELPLYDVIELLERVGALHAGGYSRLWRNSKNVNLPQAENRAAAFKIIAEDRMQAVLEATYLGFLRSGAKKPPALTSAYGWFYHWYSLRGGSAFSPYLTEHIVQHAVSKFHVTGKVESIKATYVSDQQSNCLLTETAQKCEIKQRELKKIVELYDLGVPDKGAGLTLIARADADALVTISKRLIKKKEAGTILGFRAQKSMDDFIERGLLVPFINGPASMPLTYKFLKDDVVALLSAIKQRCCYEEPNAPTSALGDPRTKVAVAAVCQAILSGKITKAWINPKASSSLRSIMIAKADTRMLYGEAIKAKCHKKQVKQMGKPFSYWRERAQNLNERENQLPD
jgi:hypothetical protein